MPRLEERARSRVDERSAFLQQYRSDVTSQRGEDGILDKLFELVGTTNRWCIEFGAWDGRYLSNTWNLIGLQDWSGVLLEGDAARFPDLEDTHGENPRAHLIQAYVGLQEQSLDDLLTSTPCPTSPDLLSIDVDGMDWHLWESLTDYRPRVVIIEFNPTIPNDVLFVQDPDPAVNQGSSLLAMIELAHDKGYELVATTEWNAFFVDGDLYPRVGIEDNSIDAMHDLGPYASRFFQLYDGTVVLAGMQKLLWRGRDITQDEMQVLSPEDRRAWSPD
jgi:hypothetical protein